MGRFGRILNLLFAGLVTASVAAGESSGESALTLSELDAREGEYISRNAYFEVVAPDQVSGLFVASLSEVLMERFQRSFSLTGSFTPRILVALTPEAEFRFSGSFHTVARGGGHVSVHIRWGPETSRAIAERALAQGLLTRLSFGYNQEEAIHVPLWVELALQHVCRVQAVGSHQEWLRKRTRNEAPLGLEAVIGATRDGDLPPMFEESAFWLWMLLEREGRRGGELRSFLIRLLRGEDPVEALLLAFGGRFGDLEEARLWWLVGLNENLRRGVGPMWPAGDSLARIEELSRFVVLVAEQAGTDSSRSAGGTTRTVEAKAAEPQETLLTLEELWQHRASRALRAEVVHRLRVLQVEIGGAHPFFHNAWLSLGSALEGFRFGNEERFNEGVRMFHADLRQGRELMETVSSLLDDLSEELAY